MHERDYLGEAAVAEFLTFLGEFVCRGHPGVRVRVGGGARRQTVRTLAEAIDHYRWRGEAFGTVHAKTETFGREIRDALHRCRQAQDDADARRLAELELLFASTKLLSWSRVYEGAFGFLLHQAENGVLAENLDRASALMDGLEEDVAAFDDSPYRSDCAMTRVYGAISRRSVVYDARLGAALGLLCRLHLECLGRQQVPAALAFMVGEAGDPRRDPSRNGLEFTGKAAGREHARWNLRATWIVSRIAGEPRVAAVLGGDHRERIRRIEAALFLIGKDVHDQPRVGRAGSPVRAPRRAIAVDGASGTTRLR